MSSLVQSGADYVNDAPGKPPIGMAVPHRPGLDPTILLKHEASLAGVGISSDVNQLEPLHRVHRPVYGGCTGGVRMSPPCFIGFVGVNLFRS